MTREDWLAIEAHCDALAGVGETRGTAWYGGIVIPQEAERYVHYRWRATLNRRDQRLARLLEYSADLFMIAALGEPRYGNV